MSLYQVQQSWSEYSKSLSSPAVDTLPKKTLISQLSSPTSHSSTPDSSSSSLSNTTAQTTPSGDGASTPSEPADPISESPLFVTWNTISPSDDEKHLRGCIGTFSSLPLFTALPSYALTSALSDTRFSPISLRELPTLSVSVTLLTDFEPASSPLDWEIGTHGIKINFKDRGRRYGACYLPDVMVEQEWNQEEAVISAMRKGGWSGRKSAWKDVSELEVVRFKGEADHLDYEDFKKWREWEEKNGAGIKRM